MSEIDELVWYEQHTDPCQGCVHDLGPWIDCGEMSLNCLTRRHGMGCHTLIADGEDVEAPGRLFARTRREIADPCRECGDPVAHSGLCSRCISDMRKLGVTIDARKERNGH